MGCRSRDARSALLRVVTAVDEDSCLVPDPQGRLPGRGAWVHPHLACLDLAERRRAFARALRRPGPFDSSAVREHLEDVVSTPRTDESGSNS